MPRPRRLVDPVPVGEMRQVEERSFLARAVRVGAIAFCFVALAGVSALLALLIVGSERSAAPIEEESVVAAESAATVPPPSEQTDAPVRTASTESKQDRSRMRAPGQSAGRAGGTVTAAGAPEASLPAPQPAESQPAPIAANAGTAVAPPTDTSEAVATPEAEPSRLSAASAPAEAAPAEIAATKIDDRSAEPARRPAEPVVAMRSVPAAVATRSAPVTTGVNMRASADNGAAVVAVVPAGKNVGVVACAEWCEVLYGEQQGFIHKRFVSGAKK